MRVTKTNNGLKIYAVAGTYVVLLGYNLAEVYCDGLLGFSIHRTDHSENEAYYLSAMKAFAELRVCGGVLSGNKLTIGAL